jgi:hypothetical protein
MIIASPAKKEISIPLQPMTSAVSSPTSSNTNNVIGETAAVDVVTINSRNNNGKIYVYKPFILSNFLIEGDFIVQVFGQTSVFNTQVNETLSITTTHVGYSEKSMRTLCCEAFIHNDTVFLSSPFVGNNAGLLNWANGEFQSW